MTRRQTAASPARAANWPAVGLGLLLLAGGVVLYAADHALYVQVLGLWGAPPFPVPFIDTAAIPAAIACWDRGIDVYTSNPCDLLGRVHNYSPLWLRLTFLPTDPAAATAMGLLLALAFLASLAVLPRSARPSDTAALLLAIASPMTAFAVERGNIDLVVFVLAALAVVCLQHRLAIRTLGYGAMLLAGLLKFYPLALLLLLMRERRPVVLALTGVALLVIGACVAAWHAELARALAHIPVPVFFDDGFGARKLPQGLQFAAGGLSEWPSFVWLVLLPLFVLAAAGAGILAARPRFRVALAAMTERERLCLAVGAALVCGCFVAGTSIPYRGILLLFAIPGLLRLPGRLLSGAGWLAVGLMWSNPPRRLVDLLFGTIPATGSLSPAYAFWLAREALWWWLIAVLLAVLIYQARSSPVVRQMWPRAAQGDRLK